MTNEAADYGVRVERTAGEGLAYRVRRVRHLPPEENRGKHHVYVNVYDQHGHKDRAVRVAFTWEGHNGIETVPLDKPDNEPMGNVPMFRGQMTTVWVKSDRYKSEIVRGMHTGHPDETSADGFLGNSWGHHSFEVDFQLSGDLQTGPTPVPQPESKPQPNPPPQPETRPVYADWFPAYIFGLHEPGGEKLMLDAGKKGWVLFLAEIGLHGNVVGDYRFYADQGLGIVTRINHGYGSTGTIPVPEKYAEFAEACLTFVQKSQGCHIWIIGNEPNHEQEWPDGRKILPEGYAHCYNLCRRAIHSLPGHAHDLVLAAGPAPWNNQVQYAGNMSGDWVKYFKDMIAFLDGCDGFSIHTYTHAHDPEAVRSSPFHGAAGYTHLRNEFWTFEDWMEAIPLRYRNLPVLITETNPAAGWRNTNNGWIYAAYQRIARWNEKSGNQKIQGLFLYRWPRLSDQPQWSISDRTALHQDFVSIMDDSSTQGYEVHLPQISSGEGGPGVPTETGYTTANLNVRSGPGVNYPQKYLLPMGTEIMIYERIGSPPDQWVRIGVDEWSSATFITNQKPQPPTSGTGTDGWLISAFSRLFRIEQRVVQAVLQVESGGAGFRGGRMVIRNELHVLWGYFTDKALFNRHFDFNRQPGRGHMDHRWRASESSGWSSPHQSQDTEWACFEFARSLNRNGAFSSISMGAGQVMGFNHGKLSYLTAEEMFNYFSMPDRGLDNQLVGTFAYCYNTQGLIEAIREKNWRQVARLYNGSSAVDHYSKLLEDAYNRGG